MQRGKGVRRVPGGVPGVLCPWAFGTGEMSAQRWGSTHRAGHTGCRCAGTEEALVMVFALIWQRTEQGYLEQEWGPLNPVGHSGWALASLGTGRGLCSVDLRHCQCGPRAIHGASLLANVQPSLFLIREPVYGSYSVLSLGVAERILL